MPRDMFHGSIEDATNPVADPKTVDEILAREKEHTVKIHVGTSVLSRDLVWCECDRGISLHGTWQYCPKCGGKIDQESYQNAVEEATKYRAGHFYVDPDDREALIEVTKERDELKAKLAHIASWPMSYPANANIQRMREYAGAEPEPPRRITDDLDAIDKLIEEDEREKKEEKLTPQNCTRAPYHDGPCNGWPVKTCFGFRG